MPRDLYHQPVPEPSPQPRTLPLLEKKKKKLSKINAGGVSCEVGAVIRSGGKARVRSCWDEL